MISVGVDVSKGKSTVCVMKPYGEIVLKPFEVQHTESELSVSSFITLMLLQFVPLFYAVIRDHG